MPTLSDHVVIARRNETFCHYLLSEDKHLDWVVTAFFYSAIHYVEAYLARAGTHSQFHRTRDSSIARDVNIRPLYDDFNDLKNDSIQARYQGFVASRSDITSRIKPSLERIRERILSLIT